MTVKDLKMKLNDLALKGLITEDTQVLGISDEFAEYHFLDPKSEILVDLEKELVEINDSIEYAKNNGKDNYLKSLLEKKAKYEKFGNVAICIC